MNFSRSALSIDRQMADRYTATPATRSRSATDWTAIRVTPEIQHAASAYLIGKGPLALGDVLELIEETERPTARKEAA